MAYCRLPLVNDYFPLIELLEERNPKTQKLEILKNKL